MPTGNPPESTVERPNSPPKGGSILRPRKHQFFGVTSRSATLFPAPQTENTKSAQPVTGRQPPVAVSCRLVPLRDPPGPPSHRAPLQRTRKPPKRPCLRRPHQSHAPETRLSTTVTQQWVPGTGYPSRGQFSPQTVPGQTIEHRQKHRLPPQHAVKNTQKNQPTPPPERLTKKPTSKRLSKIIVTANHHSCP